MSGRKQSLSEKMSDKGRDAGRFVGKFVPFEPHVVGECSPHLAEWESPKPAHNEVEEVSDTVSP